ncbi:hypothetical protein FRX31_023974 [Thalictrum thalictroides]|uniref:Uncharacterized protein n=1 Tax=Thalictrum thalictroides TaxID=46969 RepID=A0A7J6VQI2_THATH|nr:hypothetical protein FRX31_023974 [Thalictrum thalictroides]
MDVFIPEDYVRSRRLEMKKRAQQQQQQQNRQPFLYVETKKTIISSEGVVVLPSQENTGIISPSTPSVTSPNDQSPLDRIFGCFTP